MSWWTYYKKSNTPSRREFLKGYLDRAISANASWKDMEAYAHFYKDPAKVNQIVALIARDVWIEITKGNGADFLEHFDIDYMSSAILEYLEFRRQDWSILKDEGESLAYLSSSKVMPITEKDKTEMRLQRVKQLKSVLDEAISRCLDWPIYDAYYHFRNDKVKLEQVVKAFGSKIWRYLDTADNGKNSYALEHFSIEDINKEAFLALELEIKKRLLPRSNKEESGGYLSNTGIPVDEQDEAIRRLRQVFE